MHSPCCVMSEKRRQPVNYPDNGAYMVVAYTVAAVMVLAYTVSLWIRVKKMGRDQ